MKAAAWLLDSQARQTCQRAFRAWVSATPHVIDAAAAESRCEGRVFLYPSLTLHAEIGSDDRRHHILTTAGTEASIADSEFGLSDRQLNELLQLHGSEWRQEGPTQATPSLSSSIVSPGITPLSQGLPPHFEINTSSRRPIFNCDDDDVSTLFILRILLAWRAVLVNARAQRAVAAARLAHDAEFCEFRHRASERSAAALAVAWAAADRGLTRTVLYVWRSAVVQSWALDLDDMRREQLLAVSAMLSE